MRFKLLFLLIASGEAKVTRRTNLSGNIVITRTAIEVKPTKALTFDTITDQSALSMLYASTRGNTWIKKKGWLTGIPCTNDWYGVTCNNDGKVAELKLIGNNLNGTLPSQVGQLTLKSLWSTYNDITGYLPSQIGYLSSIVHDFVLYSNRLSGSIPSEIGKLSLLSGSLMLMLNSISGSIPSQIGSLASMTNNMKLNQNSITATLPTEMGLLTAMTSADQFTVAENSLCGLIPSEISSLTSLDYTDNSDIGTLCCEALPDKYTCEPSPAPTNTPLPSPNPSAWPSQLPTISMSPSQVPTTLMPTVTPLPTSVPLPQPTLLPTTMEPTPTPIPTVMPTYPRYGLHVVCHRWWDKRKPDYCDILVRFCFVWMGIFAMIAIFVLVWTYREILILCNLSQDQRLLAKSRRIVWQRFGPRQDSSSKELIVEENEQESSKPKWADSIAFILFILLSQMDYLSDAYYIGVAHFASPLLIIAAMILFCFPTLLLGLQFRRNVISQWQYVYQIVHDSLPWTTINRQRRRFFSNNQNSESCYQSVLKALGFVLFSPFYITIATLRLFLFTFAIITWTISFHMFVECKLHILPQIVSSFFLFGNSSRRISATVDQMNHIFNSTIVFRTFISGLLQLIVVLVNTQMITKQTGGDLWSLQRGDSSDDRRQLLALYFQICSSALMILSQIYPVGSSVYRNGGISNAMRKRKFLPLKSVQAPDRVIRFYDSINFRTLHRGWAARSEFKKYENPHLPIERGP